MFRVHVMMKSGKNHSEWFSKKSNAINYTKIMKTNADTIVVECHNELTGERIYV